MLKRIQRLLAIRICGAYRTISLKVVLVIAGLIPIERLALERARRYLHTINDEYPTMAKMIPPQHAIFECRMFEHERILILGNESNLTPKNFIPRKLRNKDEWGNVDKLVKLIMKTREDDEWDMQNTEAWIKQLPF
ncbi:jg21355 [Pararge aegeria aegeria]|uniref:Jg21355 protein n=1 Tax=Pararge aegeria aegeria TaxID=348720 RepID=A0A8S4QPM3_9NEOP|nr:jg21355 [Pararge aegeria aegeria]